MFWLGLILPICFIAGLTGASIPTQWSFLSIALLPTLWRHSQVNRFHWFGLLFVGYAALSLWWSSESTAMGLWLVVIVVLSFWLGSVSPDLSPLWRGLAIGLSISSVVAVAQAAGWSGVESSGHPAGLLFNPTIQAASMAMVIVALACQRDWFHIPAMLPGLWLADSRGGLGVGLISHMIEGQDLLLGPSDIARWQIWRAAFGQLTIFGHGAGSFAGLLYQVGPTVFYPEHVHNDYLQLAYEFGIAAAPVYYIYIACLARVRATWWPAFAVFAGSGLFFFPLYTPVPAFAGAVLAGHLLRSDGYHRRARNVSRFDFLSRLSAKRRGAISVGDVAVSAAPSPYPEV